MYLLYHTKEVFVNKRGSVQTESGFYNVICSAMPISRCAVCLISTGKIKKVFDQAFSLKRLAGSRGRAHRRRPQTAKYPIRRRSEKGELPNSPVDCLVRGKALTRERFPYYGRHLLQPPFTAAATHLLPKYLAVYVLKAILPQGENSII